MIKICASQNEQLIQESEFGELWPQLGEADFKPTRPHGPTRPVLVLARPEQTEDAAGNRATDHELQNGEMANRKISVTRLETK